MDKTALQLFIAVLTLSSLVISMIAMFHKKELFLQTLSRNRSVYKRKVQSFLAAFFKVYQKELLIILASLLLAAAFFAVMLYRKPAPSGFSAGQADSSMITSPSVLEPFASPPVYLSTLDGKRLDELNPIITNKESFFYNSSDGFQGIRVDGEVYQHGIVMKISEPDTSNASKTVCNESIEYALRNECVGMTFSLGVDESSFDDSSKTGPACKCRVVFQSIGTDQVSQEDENIIFDSSEFDYRLKKTYVYVDLTGVDILRIIGYWEYDNSPTGQSSINIAIVEPVLYLKKS